MKVLLVNPEFPDTYWSFKHALPFENKKCAFPPLGLLTVSAMLPPTWEKQVVDVNVTPLEDKDIMQADIVLATSMLVQKDSLREIVKRCKAMGKRTVIGGPYITTTSEDLPEADHIFLGEVEETFPQFLADLERGEAKSLYQANDRPKLTSTPPPDLHLIDLSSYSSMSVQYSRGCPFSCEFCDIIEIYGRVPRTKNNDQVIAEFDQLYSLGWRGTVFIVDDNFIGNKKNVRQLLPRLVEWQKERDFPFSLLTEASLNLADDSELLCLMQQAGFRRMFVGIETPDAASLKEAQKSQNRGDMLAQIRIIQSFGMEVMAGFIVGFDNDTDDIFERQINFINQSGIPLAMVGLLEALPNTQLWRRLEKENRLLGEPAGNNTQLHLNFITKMDSQKVIEGYKLIMASVYNPRVYYNRVLESLKRTTRSARTRYDSVNWRKDFPTLKRIIRKLGVEDRYRFQFWWFMVRAALRHKTNLAEPLRFAALGHHFRKLTEAMIE